MKFKDYVKLVNEVLANRPESAEMDVFQTSCLDDPYRFPTNEVYVGELWCVEVDEETVAWFNNDKDAKIRLVEEKGDIEQDLKLRQCIVIGAY